MHPPIDSRKSGFTLIELSIVLVIIALVIGGVVVGKELLEATKIRTTLAQLDQFKTAVSTFKMKYGSLPGDMGSTKANQFNFSSRPSSHASGCGYGDENGIIHSWNITWLSYCNNASGYMTPGEPMMFWVDLSDAGLIPNIFETATMLANPASITHTTTPAVKDYLPAAKLEGGNYFFVFSTCTSSPDCNLYGLSNIDDAGGWMDATSRSLQIWQAQTIDKKLDDGLPQAGRVRARWLSPNSLNDAGAEVGGGCNNYGPSYRPDVYGQNSKTCALTFTFK